MKRITSCIDDETKSLLAKEAADEGRSLAKHTGKVLQAHVSKKKQAHVSKQEYTDKSE